MDKKCQHNNKNKYYIYKVIHNEELIYVGKGQGERYKHVNSGASHNKQLNELYYKSLYESTSLPEVILEYCDSEQDALEKEHELIYTHKPYCNSHLKYSAPKGYFEEEFVVDDMYVLDFYEDWDF